MSAQPHRDWDDVLRRAGVRPHRGRRRAVLLVLASLSLAVALFATPAFGLREAVLDLIGRSDVEFEQSRPAPDAARIQFEELALGIPPQMDPSVVVGESRRVGTFRVRSKDRPLWVAPTERGGFCYFLEGSSGGCLRQDRDTPLPPLVANHGIRVDRDSEVTAVGTLSGWLFTPAAARVTVHFEDGQTKDVRFVYVSKPIDAGFFAYSIQERNRREGTRPNEVVVRNRAGEVIARKQLEYRNPLELRPRSPIAAPSRGQRLPATPPVPPTPPLQRGEARGVTILAGANEVAVFDATGADPDVLRLLEGRASFGCFRVRGATEARRLDVSGEFATKVGLRYFNLGTPFDGCEIQGSYGHRWPDRHGTHSAVEVPFTPAGGRYFEDRAAARDLALFVRARKVQQLRKLTGDALAGALGAEFGAAIDRLGSRDQRPNAGRIGYWPGPGRSVFRRVSSTGRVFEVEVRAGRIARDNLGELAKVF